MKNSFILRTLLNIYEKFLIYYKNSGFYRVSLMMGQSFGKLAAGSGILRFFDREWNIEAAWKRSRIFRILILPLRLLKYSSDRLSTGTNSTLKESRALRGMRALLEDLYNINSRVYGLLFLTFAVTQGLLSLVFNHGELLLDMKGIVRLVLFILGTIMILINRPVKSLVEGSMAGRIAYDFFTVRGLKNGTDDKI
ncbi:MAG TPA: hypothetical protein VEB00_11945 [Clostridia bacterium]|nr:hypothetical protein [Clostridia bacterium]